MSAAKVPDASPNPLHGSRWAVFVLAKLVNLLGSEKGPVLFEQLLSEIQRPTLSSADDMLAFANAMARRGGFIEAMAVVLQTYAILKVTPLTGESNDVADS